MSQPQELQPTVFCEFATLSQRNDWWHAQTLTGGLLREAELAPDSGLYRLKGGGYARVYCEQVHLSLPRGVQPPAGFAPVEEARISEVEAVCVSCGGILPKGSRIRWDSADKQVRCADGCGGEYWQGMIA